jgi:gas vesicle protein
MEEKSNKGKKDLIENVKEQTNDFVSDANQALEIAREKITETLSEENIQKVKQKAEAYTEIAKDKAIEFAGEAKENFEELKENASGMAGEAVEHLADFAEDAKEEFKEIKEKSKTFFQRLFGK